MKPLSKHIIRLHGNIYFNWCFRIVMLGKTLESPLDCKEIKPVDQKGNPSWIFIGRTDAKIEAPILWPPDAKSRLIRKTDAGKEWRLEEKGTTEDAIVSITDSVDMNLHKLQETVKDRGAWCAAVHGVAKSQTQLSNWTTIFIQNWFTLLCTCN